MDSQHLGVALSTGASQYVLLWDRLQSIQLRPKVDDKFVWKWSSDQQYSASSPHRTFFFGQCAVLGAKELNKTAAPPRCKFFLWFTLLDCCWTSAQHSLQNNGPCALWSQEQEIVARWPPSPRLLLQQRSVVLRAPSGRVPVPDALGRASPWWIASRKQIHKLHRTGFDTLLLLVCWMLWNERNSSVGGSCLSVTTIPPASVLEQTVLVHYWRG
jgi:hypothetical protein